MQTTCLRYIFYSFKLSIRLAKKLAIACILGPATVKPVQVILMQTNDMHPCPKEHLPFHLKLILGSTTGQGHLQQPRNKHLALHFVPHPLFFLISEIVLPVISLLMHQQFQHWHTVESDSRKYYSQHLMLQRR